MKSPFIEHARWRRWDHAKLRLLLPSIRVRLRDVMRLLLVVNMWERGRWLGVGTEGNALLLMVVVVVVLIRPSTSRSASFYRESLCIWRKTESISTPD